MTFLNNTKNSTISEPMPSATFLGAIGEASFDVPFKLADWLSRKTSHLSRLYWISILLLFIIITSSGCLYLILNATIGQTNRSLIITPISTVVNPK